MGVTVDFTKAGGQRFDPANVAITGGSIGTSPIAAAPKLAKIRKAIAAVRANKASGKVFCIGDSTTLGWNTQFGGGTGAPGARATSWPIAVAAQMKAAGLKATANCLNPNSNNGGLTISSYDPRYGGTWAPGGQATLGGGMFQPSGAATTLSLTLSDQTDTCEIWYVSNTGNGTITVNVDGGATLSTIDTNAAQLVRKATVTYTLGAHTINLIGSSTSVFLIAVRAYNSTAHELTFFNFGWGGGVTANFIGTTAIWSPENVLPSLAPDLTIVCLTINEIASGTALATFQSNTQKIITAAQQTGDVILMAGAPSGTQTYTDTSPVYLSALKDLAKSNSCVYIDIDARFVNYATANAAGFMNDTLHPGTYGAQDIAATVSSLLLSA